MKTDLIDFISSYCDRWCERCAFTSRCSAYAVEMAVGMCGDIREALELAVGPPQPVGSTPEPPAWLQEFENAEPTAEEIAAAKKQADERDARVEETSAMKVAWTFSMLAHEWIRDRHERVAVAADVVLKEALTVALHDAAFIAAKIDRALGGRDRDKGGHPIQNDWNGSAKVALISIERSTAAWEVIAQSTGDAAPAHLAEQLRTLRREVEREFPHAWRFVRPGFDEPNR